MPDMSRLPIRYYPFRTFAQYFVAWWPLVAVLVIFLFGLLFTLDPDGLPLPALFVMISPFLVLASVAAATSMLQARYVYVELTPDGIVRQSRFGKRTSVAWDQIHAVVWRPQRVGVQPVYVFFHRAFVLEVLYAQPDSGERTMPLAGGYQAEPNAQNIRDEIIQRLWLVPLPPSRGRYVWVRPKFAPPPPSVATSIPGVNS